MRPLLLLCIAAPLAAQDPIEALLRKPLLEPLQPVVEVQNYTAMRVAMMPGAAGWQAESARLRERVLNEIVFRGEARQWREAKTRVEFVETIESDGYRLRKLRYEIIPGMWAPAALYEPLQMTGRVPAVLNVNGHEGEGIATPYIQKRCIHLARNGVVALNPEWLGRGQLTDDDYNHQRMPQVDLTGTSGLALMYLGQTRALDILAAHANVDAKRIAVTGLSGGGWQTVMVSSLDTRVALSNPVAGHSSFITRSQFPDMDLGDAEQTPSDMAALANYTHLTSMIAPRPLQLSFNAKDSCCFRADYAGGPMLQAAHAVYTAAGQAGRFQYHLNHDPGHNYEAENRQAFYRFLGAHFFDGKFPVDEKPAEVRSAIELTVAVPPDNKTFRSVALELAAGLPRAGRATRERLREVVRVHDYALRADLVGESKQSGYTVRFWRLFMDNAWTVPATDFVPDGATGAVVLVADQGRASMASEVAAQLKAGRRVVAIDPFYYGESRLAKRDWLFSILIAGVGERPLGVQVSQMMAVARWAGKDARLVASGPRTSLAAAIAGAVEPSVGGVETIQAFASLKDILQRNLSIEKEPELFCFGLLEEFDMPVFERLMAPRVLVKR